MRPSQVTQGFILVGLDNLQRWRLHHLSWQRIPTPQLEKERPKARLSGSDQQGAAALLSVEGTLHPPSRWLFGTNPSVPADPAELVFTPEKTAATSSLETQTPLRLLTVVVQQGARFSAWMTVSNSDPVSY